VPIEVVLTGKWKEAYPSAMIGILGMQGVVNPDRDAALQDRAAEVQSQIRGRFSASSRAQMLAIPALRAYSGYYKRFGKTYHVQLQLESVLFRGKTITGPSALVEAMLIAELNSLLLTAGHDIDSVQGPLTVDVSAGAESYTVLAGGGKTLKAGDMFIRDEEGILSSIIYGPDWRTRVTPHTRSAIFTIYAPVGISRCDLEAHLSDLESTVRLFSPEAVVDTRELLSAP